MARNGKAVRWFVGCCSGMLVASGCGSSAASGGGGALDVAQGSDASDIASDVSDTTSADIQDIAPDNGADSASSDATADSVADIALDSGPKLGCGDGLCTSPETTASCPADCPKPVCGDALCQKPESGISCALDCAPNVQTELNCIKKLCPSAVATCSKDTGCADLLGAALQCASDANGDTGLLDFCAQNLANNPASKALATPNCGFAACASSAPSAVCGDGVCAGSESSASCGYDCLGVAGKCGDGVCTGSESNSTCPADCTQATVCGNGKCEPGEDSDNCLSDCPKAPVCGDAVCETAESSTCPLDCDAALKAKGDCQRAYCGGEFDACAADSKCIDAITAWLKCAIKCTSGDLLCVLGCQSTLGGNQDASALASCSNTNCP